MRPLETRRHQLLWITLTIASCTPTRQPVAVRPALPAGPRAPQPEPEPENPCEGLCRDYGRCREYLGGCVAWSDEDCQQAERCRTRGLCTADHGKCVQGKNDCAVSYECREGGRCTWVDGHCQTSCDDEAAMETASNHSEFLDCVAAPDRACAVTLACEKYGMCARYHGRCVRSDAGCAALDACAERGACSSFEEFCAPTTDADCEKSAICRSAGKCSVFMLSRPECVGPERCGDGMIVREGHCVRPPGYDCKVECETRHRCDAHEFDGYVMCVETAEYCRNHPACKFAGICEVSLKWWREYNKCGEFDDRLCGEWEYGGCVKSEADCQKSVGCRKVGNCSAASPSAGCRPTRPEHCKQSEICKKEGQCRLLDESSYHICGD